jgi:hypothetical protein
MQSIVGAEHPADLISGKVQSPQVAQPAKAIEGISAVRFV